MGVAFDWGRKRPTLIYCMDLVGDVVRQVFGRAVPDGFFIVEGGTAVKPNGETVRVDIDVGDCAPTSSAPTAQMFVDVGETLLPRAFGWLKAERMHVRRHEDGTYSLQVGGRGWYMFWRPLEMPPRLMAMIAALEMRT